MPSCHLLRRLHVVAVLGLVAALSGCAANPQETYVEGRRALVQADYIVAREAYQRYLSGETEPYEQARAMYELSRLLYLGLGGEKRQQEAAHWLGRVADRVDAADRREALHLLAEMYRHGEGVTLDPGKAMTLLQASGYSRALADLTMMYWVGDGVPQDKGRAARVAAEISDYGDAGQLFRHRVFADYCREDTRAIVPERGCVDDEGLEIQGIADQIWRVKPPETDLQRLDYLARLYPAVVDGGFEARANWYRYAADIGNARAQFHLARIYNAPTSPWHDPDKAWGWLETAARQGDAKAQLAMGVELAVAGHAGENHYDEALDWLRRAADQGEPEARLWLARMYMNPPDGQPKLVLRAVEQLERIAPDDDRARHGLADIYLSGMPGLADESSLRAVKLLEGMASGGDAEAAYKLGAVYVRGVEGVAPSLVDAVRWLQRAADQGHLRAGLLLARVLDRDGRADSAARARELFVGMPGSEIPSDLKPLVSQARYRQALYLVGQPDAAAQTDRILQLLELAAEEQNLAALAFLGLLYDRGELVARDAGRAYQYLDQWDVLYEKRLNLAKEDGSVWSELEFERRHGNAEALDALIRLRIQRLSEE